jgi:hypothetical protein
MIIETTLVRFLQRVANTVGGMVSEILSWGFELFLEAVEPGILRYATPVIDQLLETPDLPTWFTQLLIDVRSGGQQIDAIFGGQMVGGAASSGMLSILEPLFTAVGYAAWQVTPIREPDIMSLIALGWRGTYSPEDMRYIAGRLGFREDITDGLESIARPRVGLGDLMDAWFRNELGREEVETELRKRGYDEENLDLTLALARPIHSLDAMQKLLYRGEITPTEFEEGLEKLGYTAAQREELSNVKWQLLSGGDIVELSRRGVLAPEVINERLREHGFTEARVAEILEVGRPLTGLSELIRLYYREEITPEEFKRRLGQYGYNETQLDELEKLTHLIPNPQDLISMAVREAFHPTKVEQYQYLDEFPPEFAEWMKKQGYDQEWSEKYWVSHWRLPSLTMGYEMFHRGIITPEELDDLFVTSDIAPFWRGKLKDAAYRPLTRVDVRRMYGMDVLDEDAVRQAYLNLGYSPENAEHMLNFTIKYETSGDRDATKADILRAMNAGVISPEDARDQLVGMGYNENWADIYIMLEQVKRAEKLLQTEIDILEDQYIDGMVDRSAVYTLLGEWDLPSTQIQNYLEEWDIVKRRKVSLPSVTQLERHLKLGVINEAQYRESMAKRHWQEESINHFLQEIRLEVAEAAQKEEERAQKEEERVRVKIGRSEYDVIRADLDLQIAELKTAIAESEVLIGQITDYDLADLLIRQNEQLALVIVQLQEAKARAKLEHTQELKALIQQ